LTWFGKHARDLPWRRSRDPYRVWVSEIMLQQTQVATVGPYFERFVERFPDVPSLAAAREEQVLRLWEGLGYYRRARQMHSAAKNIVAVHGGHLPQDRGSLLALPGIGRYTAGAILSIAFDAREPILEANSVRVLSRLLAYESDPLRSKGQGLLWSFAEALLPRNNVGAFNQALMELGSKLCTPKSPQCHECPVATLCLARKKGVEHVIPAAKKKTSQTDVREAAVVVRRRGTVLLRRCGADERWAGLWDFLRFPIKAQHGQTLRRELTEKIQEQTGLIVKLGERLTTIKHSVTRYRITLVCYHAEYVRCSRRRDRNRSLKWIRPTALEDVPLSVTGRKIGRLLVGGR